VHVIHSGASVEYASLIAFVFLFALNQTIKLFQNGYYKWERSWNAYIKAEVPAAGWRIPNVYDLVGEDGDLNTLPMCINSLSGVFGPLQESFVAYYEHNSIVPIPRLPPSYA